MKRPILALTMGDPGGIGPEIIAKTFRGFKSSPRFTYLIIGTAKPFFDLKKKSGLEFPFNQVQVPELSELAAGKINFFDVAAAGKVSGAYVPGQVNPKNAAAALETLRTAAGLAVQGKVQAMVTAPLNKTSMRLASPGFHGHTEFLAAAAGVKKFAMMFVSAKLKVTLVTIHVPISGVSRLITQQTVLEKIQLTFDFIKKRCGVRSPKIAVCALNPHGRETGTEDELQIRPAVRQAQRRGIQAVGPLSADQVFHDAYEGRFDAVVSMYHDQGLAPFKMISFRDGVNVTLGLPFVRTSPDHGTAFDIAYQNKADASSFIASLRLAEKLIG